MSNKENDVKKYLIPLDIKVIEQIDHRAIDLKIPRRRLINNILKDYLKTSNYQETGERTSVRKKRKKVKA